MPFLRLVAVLGLGDVDGLGVAFLGLVLGLDLVDSGGLVLGLDLVLGGGLVLVLGGGLVLGLDLVDSRGLVLVLGGRDVLWRVSTRNYMKGIGKMNTFSL